MEFDTVTKPHNNVFQIVKSQAELNEILSNYNISFSLGHHKLLRMKYNFMYWPPSLHTFQQMQQYKHKLEDGSIDPKDLTVEIVEGYDIHALFEPIYLNYLEVIEKQLCILMNIVCKLPINQLSNAKG